MRLSEWHAAAPHPTSLGPKVEAVVISVLTSLGADLDPECWIVWGEDPASHWMAMAPTDAGLAVVSVRVFYPQEGPRANHRMLSFQIEGQILRAVDADVDVLSAFIRHVLAAMDGRPATPVSGTPSTGAVPIDGGGADRPADERP